MLQEELRALQAEHDELQSRVNTSTPIIPESADSILANLCRYNDNVCKVITTPTPPVATVTTAQPSTSTVTVPIFSTASKSESSDPTAPNRLKLDANEFFPNGQRKLLSPFMGADFQGLIMQNQITPVIRNQIAKDQYFELSKMFKSDEVVSTVISAPPSGMPLLPPLTRIQVKNLLLKPISFMTAPLPRWCRIELGNCVIV